MPDRLSAADAIGLLKAAAGLTGRVFVPGCAGEPLLFAEAFSRSPELAAGLTFLGVWIPGVNRTDWSGLHPTARAEQIFLSADWRAGLEAGRIAHRPLAYTQAWPWLETTPLDAALFQVSPPAKDGTVSFGVAADFQPAVIGRRDVFRLAHVNPSMPDVPDGPRVPLDVFDAVVEADHLLLTLAEPDLDEAFATLGEEIARVIPDGATIQFGLGKAQTAILRALSDRTGLHIHSGMISDPVLPLLEAGRIEAIETGVALGGPALYEACRTDRRIRFRPVGRTHSIATLSAIPRFCAVNSAIEVDLFGQANAEFIAGRQVSGTGGLVDFLRGAALSDGGVPILALNATAHGGSVSRIVPQLQTPAVSIARADAGVVVTEFGSADLRGLPIGARAEALIAIAAPQHRAMLSDAWADASRRL